MNAHMHMCTLEFLENDYEIKKHLRAVPTTVIAHTFCASRGTQVFLSMMLSNTVIFLHGLKLSVESTSL